MCHERRVVGYVVYVSQIVGYVVYVSRILWHIHYIPYNHTSVRCVLEYVVYVSRTTHFKVCSVCVTNDAL